MRLLDLFSGTGSFRKIAERNKWEVISLDIDGRSTITEDILEWNYRVYPPKYFDYIIASPPCDDYSMMNNCRPEKKNLDLTHSNDMVKKTLEIISYFSPPIWIIENPMTGLLKAQEFMQGLPYCDVDYCKYDYPIRKRTRIWTNKKDFVPKICHKDCGKVIDNKHLSLRYMNGKNISRIDMRHTIPSLLVQSLLD